MPKKAPAKSATARKPAKKSGGRAKPSNAKATAKKPSAETIAPEPIDSASRVLDGDKAFSEHYKVSTRTVQTWRDKGLPHDEIGHNKYRYDLNRTDEWVEAFRKHDEDTDSIGFKKELNELKLRAERTKVERLEREEQEARGNILPRSEWEAFVVELIHVTRGQLLQLPKQARRHMCNKCGKKVPDEIDKLIRKALSHLAKAKDGPPKE